MIKKIYSNPDIYTIDIPLPNNPLKNLNCYVIKTPEKNLIIDTGFNLKECYNSLKAGLDGLEIDMSKTEMFLTHLHSDHVGLAGSIMPAGGTIYMGNIDYNYFVDYVQGESWDLLDAKFLSEGFPENAIALLHTTNPARAYAPDESFFAVTVEDGEKITVGDYVFTCIFTPGHTPGHMCLYLETEKLIFLGDHVLFDITPNITFWRGNDNSLKQYLESLEKIRNMDIAVALPAHRRNNLNFYARIKELLKHHHVRLEESYSIISNNPNLHAYDIAGKMQWSMRGKNWDAFPMSQKWFAVGETVAHLDYLLAEGKIKKNKKNGVFYYETLSKHYN